MAAWKGGEWGIMSSIAARPVLKDALFGAAVWTVLVLVSHRWMQHLGDAFDALEHHTASFEATHALLDAITAGHIGIWLGGLFLGGLLAKRADERYQAARAIKTKLGLATEVFESAAEGIIVTDAGARIVEVNPAFTTIFGHPPEAVIGQNARVLQSGRHDPAFYERMWDTLRTQGRWQGEIWNRRKNGDIFPEWLSVAAIRDKNGAVQQYLGIFSDMTSQVEARETMRAVNSTLESRVRERTGELEAANQDLQAFAYSVAHDLRAPLRTVEGFTRYVLDEEGERLTDEGRHALDRAWRGAGRMEALIEDLLQLSRLGKAEARRESLSLQALVTTIGEELRPQYPGSELVLGTLPTFRGDAGMLRQLFQNLIGNALKFSSKKPAPRVEVGERKGPHGERVFFVADNGAGFDMARADALFRVFHRLHAQHDFPGTGVGLAIVQRVVERHGGWIHAEAEVDQGARFEFTLEPSPAAD